MKKHNVLADDIEDNSSTPESTVDTREDDLRRLNWAQTNPLSHLISCCYSQPGPYLKRNKYRVLLFLLVAISLLFVASFYIAKASSEDSLAGFYDIPLPHPSLQAGEIAKAVYKAWLASQNVDSETLPFINEILIGVSMGTTEFQRRQVMRSLQIQPNSRYNVTFKFVLGKPHDMYRPILQTENSTYGDLIILEDLPDSRELARYIKPFYFFRYLHREGLRYRYVAKMDSDAFLHIPTFWKKYYTEETQNLDLGIITLLCKSERENYQWPQGGFYALSWNTIELIVQLFEKIGTTTVYEDLQIARWLDLAEAKYKYVEMQPDEAYDFNREIGVLPTAMRVHEMKDDESYTLVADCFDEQGINMEKVNYWKNKNWAW